MPREAEPLKREKKVDININIADIFRNPDIQKEVIKNLKQIKPNKQPSKNKN
ncbi:MAG: hypothetical protein RLZZ605_670 [Bacteroidota bacterium]|jgi:hypothetical protein